MSCCETCVFKDPAIDGVFCEWYGESVTGTCEDCNRYAPMEQDSEVSE